MQKLEPSNTLFPLRLYFVTGTSKDLNNAKPFRQLIGALLHLANTVRPDIAFDVGYLSSFMHMAAGDLWRAGDQVLRYLIGTVDIGISFSTDDDEVVLEYSDAD